MTSLKLAEKANLFLFARSQDVLLCTLFQVLKINFYIIDRHGFLLGVNDDMLKVLGVNNKFLESLGLAHENQIVGKHVLDLGTEEAWSNCQKVIELRETITFEEHQKNSETVYLTIKTPIFDDDTGEVIGLVGISIDITERKTHEEALKKAKEAAEAANQATHSKTKFVRSQYGKQDKSS